MTTTDKRKRILYVESNIDGTVGGSHFSLLFLVEGLDKKRYAPVVLFYQENLLIPRYVQAGSRVLSFKRIEPLNFLDKFPALKKLNSNNIAKVLLVSPLIIIQKLTNYVATFLFESFNCWRVIVREKIDLIHLNNTLLRPQEWILASLFTKSKIIAHERGINTAFPSQARFWARHLKAIICISEAVRNNLIKSGFLKEQLYRIYNGLDPDKFVITKTKKEIREEFGIDCACPVIGILGNLKQWKGQEVVIKSMKYISKKIPNIKCLIIGGVSPSEIDYKKHLENIVERAKLEDIVIFTGERSDVPDIINSLSVLIHASILPEPFGRVLLEGMALEKPVISTNIGAGPEIVEDGKTGLLVPPGDEKSLAHAIISLLHDTEKASEMGKAGRIRLKRYFHISNTIKKTEELYSKILQLEEASNQTHIA